MGGSGASGEGWLPCLKLSFEWATRILRVRTELCHVSSSKETEMGSHPVPYPVGCYIMFLSLCNRLLCVRSSAC